MSLYQESGGSSEDRAAEAEKILEMLEGLDDELAPNEQEFVRSTRKRIEDWGGKAFISPKQLFWLRDIKDKVL